MRALLDTQVFLWADLEPERLGRQRDLFEESHELLLSAVVSWELAIKTSIHRLSLALPVARYVRERIVLLRLTTLSIEHDHALGVADLPLHHRDPFDRLLIAQARALGVPIITSDRTFERYDVEVLLAG